MRKVELDGSGPGQSQILRVFEPLSELERGLNSNEGALIAAWGEGRSCTLDPATAEALPIRASLIQCLVIGLNPKWPVAPGPLVLAGAKITGDLSLGFQQRDAGNRDALPALLFAGCEFTGDIDLYYAAIQGFFAFGCSMPQIDVSKADIRGDFVLSGSTVGTSLATVALNAEGANIGHDVTLTGAGNRRFKALGRVMFAGASIGGDFSATGATIQAEKGSPSLMLDRAKISGTMFLNDGDTGRFEARGIVRMLGAQITGSLDMAGAKLDGEGAPAISAVRLRVGGDAFFNRGREPFEAKGPVILSSAHFDHEFIFDNANCTDGLDLRGAHIHRLKDAPSAWPPKGRLLIDGLTYDSISFGPEERDITASRLDWLSRQYSHPPQPEEFKPQPYEQLAKVLREQGHGQAADEVAIRKRDMSITYKSERALNRVLTMAMGVVSGHGYRPNYALYWTIGWWLLGVLWISMALKVGLVDFVAANPPSVSPQVHYVAPSLWAHGFDDSVRLNWDDLWRSPHPSPGCAGVIVPVYALEMIVPVLDFGQDSQCHMISFGTVGGAVQAWRALYQIIGAVLVTILGATLTGLLRKD